MEGSPGGSESGSRGDDRSSWSEEPGDGQVGLLTSEGSYCFTKEDFGCKGTHSKQQQLLLKYLRYLKIYA